MKAWMLVFTTLVASLSFSIPTYGIDEQLNARLAPGADGKSVHLSTSIRIPSAHDDGVRGQHRVSPISFTRTYLPSVSNPGSPVCNPAALADSYPEAVLGEPADGAPLTLGTYTNRATGEVVRRYLYCTQTANSGQPVPAPPTYNDIWQAVFSEAFTDAARSSGAYVAPASPGLTGLDTRVWAQFPGGQEIVRDVTVGGGYRVQARAYISEYSLFITSPSGQQRQLINLESQGTLISAGSFEHPNATHIFRREGEHLITTAIVWNANNATLTGPLLTSPISVPIGAVRLEINRDYEVHELRPGLTK